MNLLSLLHRPVTVLACEAPVHLTSAWHLAPVQLDCGQDADSAVDLTCDHGCQRLPLHLCGAHTRTLTGLDGDVCCAACRDGGRADVPVIVLGVRPLDPRKDRS